MAGLKDIKRRIRSVKNTKKITYAMKLVSAAKLRKAQDAVKAAREYTDALGELLGQVLSGDVANNHPLMNERKEIKNIILLVVGGSRGLCGGYNTNVNKNVELTLKRLQESNPEAKIESILIGKKPVEHYKLMKRTPLDTYIELPEDANKWPIDEICAVLEGKFLNEEVDEVHMLYTRFKSAMSQDVISEKILPVSASSLGEVTSSTEESEESQVEAIFEPSAAAVFEAIIPRVLRTMVRQAGLDAKASEHGSRMVAMDAATKNAGELADKLTLTHNKLRQTAITAELLDIIGGAEATN